MMGGVYTHRWCDTYRRAVRGRRDRVRDDQRARPAASARCGALVFGARAGKAAAKYATSAKQPSPVVMRQADDGTAAGAECDPRQ